MEKNMRLSQAVKEAYRASSGKKLQCKYLISNMELVRVRDPERYIDAIKNDAAVAMAKEIQTKMDLTFTHNDRFDEHIVRGECYVFTHDELLQLLNDLEYKVQQNSRPQTIWGGLRCK